MVYVIAEIGINYNNSIDNCYKLIDAAVAAGCNAAKFQLFSADKLYPKSAGRVEWRKDDSEGYSYDIHKAVKKFELPHEWLDDLIAYCNAWDIEFLVSVFDDDGLNLVVQKGIKRVKLSSYTITHHPLIEKVAQTGLPIIMSTGGSTLGELEDAVNIIQRYHNNLTVLHCSIQYPTALNDVNLGVLRTIATAFPDVAIGYSDHTKEVSAVPVQAVYLGATVIEKHITLDKSMEGPDHFFALNPDELKIMVKDIRQSEDDYKNNNFKIDKSIFGSSMKICHDHERYLRGFAYMYLFAKKNIKKGDAIGAEDIVILRAGKKSHGLEPKYCKLFEEYNVVAKKDIGFEDPIYWEAIL